MRIHSGFLSDALGHEPVGEEGIRLWILAGLLVEVDDMGGHLVDLG